MSRKELFCSKLITKKTQFDKVMKHHRGCCCYIVEQPPLPVKICDNLGRRVKSGRNVHELGNLYTFGLVKFADLAVTWAKGAGLL